MPPIRTKEGTVAFNYGIITKGLINGKIGLLSFYSKESKKKVFDIYLRAVGNDNYLFVSIFSDTRNEYKLKTSIKNWLPNDTHEISFSWLNGDSKKYRLYVDGVLKDEIQMTIDLADVELGHSPFDA